MMTVGIHLEDCDFARALVRGLAAEGRNICFSLTEDEKIEEAFDMILTDCEIKSAREIELVRNPDEARIYEGSPYKIFRYQHASDFVHDLLFIYYCQSGRCLNFAGDIRCRTLVFTSMTGGTDATALALLTGQMLYRHFGSRCLYLNLCPIDESKCFLPEGSKKGLLTLLYYLSQEKDFPLSSFIRQYSQIDSIDTSISNPYFDELDADQMHRLLKKIDDMGKYSYLILDIGNHLSRRNKSLLAKADEIVLVQGERIRFPAPFFQEIMNLLDGLAAGTGIRTVLLDEKKTDQVQDRLFVLEDGLLDLSAMKYIQWEAGRLVNCLMGQSDEY